MKPDPRTILTDPVHLLAFGFGAGLSPVGPGTAGTIVAIPLVAASWLLPELARFALGLLLILASVWVCGASARRLGLHDYSGIVLDEIAGFYLAMLIAPVGWAWMLAGFLLFRFFDIVKPWPIAVLDRRVGGGFGIVLDDLVAALFAGLVMRLAYLFVVNE